MQTNQSWIIRALEYNPSAKDSLRRKFKDQGWLTPGEDSTAEKLVSHALGRIEMDPNQYGKFIIMLRDIEGMDLIVNKVTGMATHACTMYVFFCLHVLHCMMRY